MQLARIALVWTVALALSACSTLQIDTDYDPGFDFARLKTYAWAKKADDSVRDRRVDDDLFAQRLRVAVDRALGEKGYREVAPDAADFLVNYQVTTQRQVDVQSYPAYYGYRWGGWMGAPDVSVRQYTEGTLILDVIDARDKRAVWRGTAKAELVPGRTPEQRATAIHEAVDQIFAKFPPGTQAR